MCLLFYDDDCLTKNSVNYVSILLLKLKNMKTIYKNIHEKLFHKFSTAWKCLHFLANFAVSLGVAYAENVQEDLMKE